MRVRYLIKFSKEGELKFLAHLDMMRTIQRVVRRAALPAAYSQGFNPHMALSIAQPLPVGVYSKGDYLDLELTEPVEIDTILEGKNECSTRGIKFLQGVIIPEIEGKKAPQAMALLEAARYTLKLKSNDPSALSEELSKLLERDSLITLKKSKKGEKNIDIKPLIKEIKFWPKEEVLVINALLSCGSRENLSPELLAEYLVRELPSASKGTFVEICREEMYALKEGKLINLISYMKHE